MRSRTVREGSVGLLILLGVALFGGLLLWLRGISIGKRTYQTVIEFPNVGGMQAGASVRYRGVNVGKITKIAPSPSGVDVTIEITSADIVIPRDGLAIETSQSGFIGETYIDLKPMKPVPPGTISSKPLDSKCDSDQIVCDKSRLQGQVGVNLDDTLRSTTRLANLYSDPAFYTNINTLTKNTAVAAAGVAQLTRDLSGLTRTAQVELKNFSGSANSVTKAASQTSYQASLAANQLGNTASQFSLTAQQLNQLLGNVNELVVTNRSTLVRTLNNFSDTSDSLRVTVASLKPTLNQVNSTVGRFNSARLLNNLETLSNNAAKASADAAKASANLRDISAGLNNPKNLVMLQQTLDSARATFENTQKITADLDELTGDPAFRTNVRNLVNGLGKLVSSTQQLEQQVQVARLIAPVSATTINIPSPNNTTVSHPLFSDRSTDQIFVLGQLPTSKSASPPLFGQHTTGQITTPSQLPINQSLNVKSDRSSKQLKRIPQPFVLPSGEEWFVPDDQPESK